MNEVLRIGDDNICPVTNQPCDDECCPPGAECNLAGEPNLFDAPASPPSPAIEWEEELDRLESFNREEVKNILMEFSYDIQQEKYGGCSTHRHIVSLFIKAHRELFSTPTPPAGAEGEGEKMEQVGLFDILDQAIDEEVAEKLSAAHTKIAELEQTIREQKEWINSHL